MTSPAGVEEQEGASPGRRAALAEQAWIVIGLIMATAEAFESDADLEPAIAVGGAIWSTLQFEELVGE